MCVCVCVCVCVCACACACACARVLVCVYEGGEVLVTNVRICHYCVCFRCSIIIIKQKKLIRNQLMCDRMSRNGYKPTSFSSAA